jgi:hypothetical protein
MSFVFHIYGGPQMMGQLPDVALARITKTHFAVVQIAPWSMVNHGGSPS